jgi:hypothetical protein
MRQGVNTYAGDETHETWQGDAGNDSEASKWTISRNEAIAWSRSLQSDSCLLEWGYTSMDTTWNLGRGSGISYMNELPEGIQ